MRNMRLIDNAYGGGCNRRPGANKQAKRRRKSHAKAQRRKGKTHLKVIQWDLRGFKNRLALRLFVKGCINASHLCFAFPALFRGYFKFCLTFAPLRLCVRFSSPFLRLYGPRLEGNLNGCNLPGEVVRLVEHGT